MTLHSSRLVASHWLESGIYGSTGPRTDWFWSIDPSLKQLNLVDSTMNDLVKENSLLLVDTRGKKLTI